MEGYGCLEKWGDLNFNGENEDQENGDQDNEEETLSLCDLPVCVTKEGNEDITAKETTTLLNCEENFDFGSWGGSVLMESEMCAADEVFFQGQLLPLRLSVSSENGVLGSKLESKNSRSESMERCSSSGVTSLSSRSNSTGSHNSNSTSTTITTTTTSTYKPKFRNQFHSHPSPKPQIITVPKIGNVSRKSSTVWGIFKVGLIRTPEMELQELKLRNSNNNRSINSRSSSGSSSKMSHLEIKAEEKNTIKKKKKTERFLFDGCKCSPDNTVDTVIVRKNKKVINLSESKEVESEMKVENKEKTEKQRKQALHHRRTFEWLRELSIADVPEEL
ncbi:hypothetical protein ACHQM5_025016 [Ranunculus cassubicifolius]